MPTIDNTYRLSADETVPGQKVPDPWSLPRDRIQVALALRDRLIEEFPNVPLRKDFLAWLAALLREAGLKIDRIATIFETLHSEFAGVGRIWTWNEGLSTRFMRHDDPHLDEYLNSPFAFASRLEEWLLLDLDNTPDDAFPIIADLKALGYKQYLVIPLRYSRSTKNAIGFASREAGAFGPLELTLFNIIIPTLTLVMEVRSANMRVDNMLRIYVGEEPRQEILSGAIQRGQVTRIRSAILFSDMRDYTRIAAVQTPEETVSLLDTYFDCVVPSVEENGGEVLKFIGDGILAIFRDRGDDTGSNAYNAFIAAKRSLQRIEEANYTGRFKVPVSIGIALHHGEAAYGNVGSGSRLDFTVIGPDVNLASRLARMNRELNEPLLTSRAFAERLWIELDRIGAYPIPGLTEPVEIFRPSQSSVQD